VDRYKHIPYELGVGGTGSHDGSASDLKAVVRWVWGESCKATCEEGISRGIIGGLRESHRSTQGRKGAHIVWKKRSNATLLIIIETPRRASIEGVAKEGGTISVEKGSTKKKRR